MCVECGVWCGVECVRGVCKVLCVSVCGVEDVSVCVWCLLLELLYGVWSVCAVLLSNSVSECSRECSPLDLSCFEECSPASLRFFPFPPLSPLLVLFSTVLTFSIFCTVLLIFLSVPLSSTAVDCLNI